MSKKKDSRSNLQKFEDFWNSKDITFWREKFQGVTQIRSKDGKTILYKNADEVFKELTGLACDEITNAKGSSFATTDNSFGNYMMKCAMKNQFHILNDYLKELEDGKYKKLEGNLFTDLFDIPYDLLEEAEIDREDYLSYLNEGAYVSLVACYRRWTMPGCGDEYLPILWSAEGGTGKSTLIRNLVPHPELVYPNLTGRMLASEDQTELLRHTYRIAVAEMNELNFIKANKEVIKANITTPHFRGRMLYKNPSNFPRTDKIWGSTNLPQFLAFDDSGYRRFMVFPLKTKWREKMNHDKLNEYMQGVIRQRFTNAIRRYNHELKNGEKVYMFAKDSKYEQVQQKLAEHFVYQPNEDQIEVAAEYLKEHAEGKTRISVNEFLKECKDSCDYDSDKARIPHMKIHKSQWAGMCKNLGYTKNLRINNKRFWVKETKNDPLADPCDADVISIADI